MSVVKPEKGSTLHAMLNRTKAVSEDNIIPFIDAYLTKKRNTGTYEVVNEYKKPDGFFHPSSHPSMCKRRLYFQMSGKYKLIKIEQPPSLTRTFHIGQAVHSLVQKWVDDMGKMKGFPHSIKGAEVGVLDEGFGISGSIDDIIEFPSGNGYVLEIKTINSNQFSRLTAPKPEHQAQVQVYMFCLSKTPEMSAVQQAIVLYVEKDYPHNLKEFKVRYSEDRAHAILRRWAKVKEALIADDVSFLEHECKEGDRAWNDCPARDVCARVVK